jgi:hypothetical protein
VICGLGKDVGGDAVLLNGEEDGVCQSAANPMVEVARWIACWRGARVWPKLAGAAEVVVKSRRPGGMVACVAWGKNE